MESLDLSVGLRPIGPGSAVFDAHVVTRVTPCVCAVTAAVVGQDGFNGDPASGEPGHRPVQDRHRGNSGFVVVDLGVGHS